VTENRQQNEAVSVSIPVGLVASALILLAAGAVYMLVAKPDIAAGESPNPKGMLRRAGLLALAGAIENDFSRKAVVAIIRAVARRS